VLHGGDKVTVAAIKHQLLGQWLEQLAQCNIAPDYLFIDAFCVPDQQGQWQLLFDSDRVLFREGNSSGMRLDRQTAATVIKLAIQARSAKHADSLQQDELQRVALVASSNDAIELAALEKLGARPAGQAGSSAAPAAGGVPEQDEEQHEEQHHDPYEAALLGDDYVNPADKLGAEGTRVAQQVADVTGDAKPSRGPAASSAEASTDSNDASQLPDTGEWLRELSDLIRSENIETKTVMYSETVSQLLAVSAVQSLDRNLNILQGEFRPATANAANRRYLRKVSVAVAACVALFMLITLGGGAFLNYRADSYFDQSVAIYRSLFPKQRKVRDPVKQLKRQLRGNTVGATTSDFLPLLDAASRSLTNLDSSSGEEPSIKQLRYDIQRGHIAIDLHASNIDQLEAYRDLLSAEGLDVDILSANQDGDTIKGRIQVGRS
ncbi:MAG: hypothetical protein HKO71_07990, partial [Pseudomonadales bacterium]|nr:hypothetical protein [Pseudomonadales bacterium]